MRKTIFKNQLREIQTILLRMFRALNMLNNCPQMNATGHPAISVPCGMIDGLPVGLQIIGRHFDDFTVLRAADASEKLGDWRKR